MSIPIVIYWPPTTGNEAAIAPIQSVTVGNNLSLSSNVGNIPNTFQFDKIVRILNFTSTDNNSAVNFVITGIGSPIDVSGNPTKVIGPITEIVPGPAAHATVNSSNIYREIFSIEVTNADASNISVGYGSNGITDYVFLDYNRTIFQTAVQLQFISQTTLTATVNETLSKPETPNIQYGVLDPFQPIPAFPVSADLTNATANKLGVLLQPVTMTWATIVNTAADSLYFTVLQQGIR